MGKQINKTVLITGASQGIGEATAYAFAQKGYRLVLWARSFDQLKKVQKKCKTLGSPKVRIESVDVSKRTQVLKAIQKSIKIYQDVQILINNAGLARGFDPIQKSNVADWDEMIDTNLKGLLYVTEALLPHLTAHTTSHIVQMGSVAGRWVYPRGHVYCATKAAVKSLSEALRMDLMGSGLRVTEIAPGMVETKFSEVRLRDKQKAKSVYAGLTPLSPQDIAESILWTVERPSHVNIQEMVIYPTDQISPTMINRKTL